MSEKINVQCYKCQTVYELEPEMAGELVECAVCNTVFIIPKLTTGKEFELLHTHPYLPNGNQPSSDELEETNLQTARDMNIPLDDTSTTKLTTDTIKITKNTRGMIPEIEDDKFGIHTARNPIHKPKDNTLETLKKATPKAAKVPPENQEEQKSESEQEQEEGKKASRWWHFGRKKK